MCAIVKHADPAIDIRYDEELSRQQLQCATPTNRAFGNE
jgi:hypothetical protein